MEETAPTLELLEPASPEALLPGPLVEPWMIVVLIVLIGCLVALLVLKKRQIVTVNALAERAAAYEDAKTELAALEPPNARAAATHASLILRKYLSIAARDPALFETHEEFVSRSDSLKDLSDEARAASEAGFADLASMKYAPEIPDADPAAVVAESRSLLETLHHGFVS